MMNYFGLATQIIGTELQGWANMLAAQEMSEQFSRETRRQRQYANQARGLWQPAVQYAGVENVNKQLGEGADSRRAGYGAIGQVPLALEGGPDNRDNKYLGMRGDARAKLGAYGDMSLEQDINRLRTQQGLNQISNFAQGTASVFPYRMYDAQHEWDWLAAIGSAISSLGGGSGQNTGAPQAPPLSQGNMSAFAGGQGPQAAGYVPYQSWRAPNSSFGQMAGWPQMFI